MNIYFLKAVFFVYHRKSKMIIIVTVASIFSKVSCLEYIECAICSLSAFKINQSTLTMYGMPNRKKLEESNICGGIWLKICHRKKAGS